MIEITQEICGDLGQANQREWLETNGLGGFASSTITGLNTRRYHGLLVAATKPPVGRVVLLSKLEETLVIDGKRFDLSVNQYAGAIHPNGQQFLKSFRLAPFPIFSYEIEGVEIEKSVFMLHGENSTVIQYKANHIAGKNVSLEVRPLVAFRDYHSTTHENNALQTGYPASAQIVSIRPYADLPELFFAHNASKITAAEYWYRNFEYSEERARGLDFIEDLFNPFVINFNLKARSRAAIIASTQPHEIEGVADLRRLEIKRRKAVAALAVPKDELSKQLAAAADQFIVARGNQQTIIAGYHWFSDWGRDTMIALPGLTLATGRPETAKSILLEFAQHINQGMLPNRFPDAGEAPEYNTVDATLWFFEAIRALAAHTDDYEFIKANFYAALIDIIDWHVRGTRYGIRVDDDGLLSAGEPDVQLTWMDAKVGDWVVTPRYGKPVEIQALWYNALRIMKDFAEKFGEPEKAKNYHAMAALARTSFTQKFWNEKTYCLFDVINGVERDESVRPNQIFAISLSYSMLSNEQAKHVLAVIERDLLTPVGLRSLAPTDQNYRGRYAGGILERDGSYHQGTVWAWLLGPFVSAYLKIHGASGRVKAQQFLQSLRGHLLGAGLGQIAEIFDGDAPHTPRGCIAQAWSIATWLQAEHELGTSEQKVGATA